MNLTPIRLRIRGSAPVRLVLLAVGLALATGGCASGAKVTHERGLYWTWTEDRLQNEGYPGYRDEYSSPEWGILYDDEGVPYGPRSFYEGTRRLDHPYLEITDEYLQTRGLRLMKSDCCTEPLLGHFLELLDLALHDLRDKLHADPPVRLHFSSLPSIDAWRQQTGRDYWVTHLVDGPTILLSPIDILFRRTLASHVAFTSVAEALLDLKTHGQIPPWLRVGLASYLAEEGFEHLSFMAEFRGKRHILMHPDEVARHVEPLVDRENGRIARYNAFLMVWHLSEDWGFKRVVALLDAVEGGADFATAVRQVYGLELDAWLTALDSVTLGEPTTTLPARH